jgi:hypothetical protein
LVAQVPRAFGVEYRRGITLITLVGGLASTVFIPVAQFAVDHLGWQHALIALGGFQVVLSVPLHFIGIPRFAVSADETTSVPANVRLRAWWLEHFK